MDTDDDLLCGKLGEFAKLFPGPNRRVRMGRRTSSGGPNPSSRCWPRSSSAGNNFDGLPDGGPHPLGSRLCDLELAFATFNANSFSSLKGFLASTEDLVVFSQELSLLDGPRLLEAGEWCTRNGWKFLMLPGSGAASGISGGVGIFARSFLGLYEPPSLEGGHVVSPHRIVAAKLEVPGSGRVTVYS